MILDRYYYSTIAYQGTRGGNMDAIADMMRKAAPEPNVVIILDVPAELGIERIQKRDTATNRFEDVGNLCAVRAAFQALASGKMANLFLVDGTLDQASVHKAILHHILGIVHVVDPHSRP